MEIRIYDPQLDFKGISENQTSFVWTWRYFESGEFRIYLPLTEDNLALYKIGNLVTYRGANEAGVIEDLTLRNTSTERVIVARGRFLTSYMDRRLVRPTLNFSGKVEVAMRKMLSDAVAIPLVQLGTLNGFTETIEFQATYKNLLTMEEKLSKGSNIGFRFRPDFTAKAIYFETYKGVDRSRTQTDRAFVEFSDMFDNLNSVENRQNDQLLKNVGYVGGEGEGSQRVYVTVGNDSLTGLERREVFIDAKDISSDDLTTAQYRSALTTRGNEKLNEQIFSNSYECTTIPSGNFEYKRDYDLGDIVTIKKADWGLNTNLRITEIQEVYEHGSATIVPTFGSPLPTKINMEDK
jgi:hypothetical protein